MQIQTIEKSVEIHATPDKVWQVLFDNASNKFWLNEFSAGTQAQGDWTLGGIIRFFDSSETGIVGKVDEVIPNERLVIKYTGVIVAGKDDFESEDALAMNGLQESYELAQKEDWTVLSIRSDMDGRLYSQMSAAWDRALQIIKRQAEEL